MQANFFFLPFWQIWQIFRIPKRRKRGCKGGIKLKIRKNVKNRTIAVPPIIFGNVRSIQRKIDELCSLCRYLHQYRDPGFIAITESWLSDTVPLPFVEINNFTCVRLDRTANSNKVTCGGLLLYINEYWCSNYNMINSVCNPDYECLTVNLRPHYLPREISNIFVTIVYIPPSSNYEIAANSVSRIIHNLSDKKPQALNLLCGDVNN